MVYTRRLSFSPFVVLMSATNGEKDSLLGQTVLPTELGQILGGLGFFCSPFICGVRHVYAAAEIKQNKKHCHFHLQTVTFEHR